jgi:hypothetical protein
MIKYNKSKYEEIKGWDDEKWIEEIIAKIPLSGDFRIDNIFIKIYQNHCEIDTTEGHLEGYDVIEDFFETAFKTKRGNFTESVYWYIANKMLEYGFINNSNPGTFVITDEGQVFKTKRTFKKYYKSKNIEETNDRLNKKYGFWISLFTLLILVITFLHEVFCK